MIGVVGATAGAVIPAFGYPCAHRCRRVHPTEGDISGVITDQVTHPTDERVGRAHALVRVPLAPDTKKQVLKPVWNAFRKKLLDATLFKIDRDGQWTSQPVTKVTGTGTTPGAEPA